ncbi:hypothetical protein [Lentibacter sp. XHP0401]|uniref:hypothetical protein n=1 Tax=Lentibacter sp. XHP0401 TaxID=2984334 RepID=UPI0021E886CD|nr:hypothetical protein [Lentibacter sp. XHP0401]MCV2892575.1 hypothetical protein [Lentibacter sp. XHP0401]
MAVTTPKTTKQIRDYPEIGDSKDGQLNVTCKDGFSFEELMGMKTQDAAKGVLTSALNALGENGACYRTLAVSIFAELEPRDAIEAMLVAQMTATHALMTSMASRAIDATNSHLRETHERSMTRLSRTYLAQIDALKKYRAKAQQVVRVERVTVHEGGQAIVGDVTHGGRADIEN